MTDLTRSQHLSEKKDSSQWFFPLPTVRRTTNSHFKSSRVCSIGVRDTSPCLTAHSRCDTLQCRAPSVQHPCPCTSYARRGSGHTGSCARLEEEASGGGATNRVTRHVGHVEAPLPLRTLRQVRVGAGCLVCGHIGLTSLLVIRHNKKKRWQKTSRKWPRSKPTLAKPILANVSYLCC